MSDDPPPVDFGPWPHHDEAELAAAAAVLRSGRTNYWTGDEGRSFEREYAAHLGRAHAVAVHNGTLALELALVALGVGPGDEVITTPRTFIASASAVVMRGATPVLVDVEADSGNLSARTVAPAIGPRTRAIIAVHLGGWPVDMAPLMELARSHGVAVIEDCAQAHGATVHGKPVGALGDLAAFSFCQDKIISTGGEGGMLLMDDEARWRAAWAYKDHGKSYAAIYEREQGTGYRRVYESFGTNWRMTEVSAAIGRRQLDRLPAWVDRRRAIARRYAEALEGCAALRLPRPPEGFEGAYYRFYTYLRPEALASGWDRDRVLAEVSAAGVPCFVGSASELYLERAFADAGLGPPDRLPTARALGETSLALLCHPTLSDEAVDAIAERMRAVVERATR